MGAIEELSTELVSGLLSNGRNLPDASGCPKPRTRSLAGFPRSTRLLKPQVKVMGNERGMNACVVLPKAALTPDAVHVLGDTLDSPLRRI
jgi:hypothetical protein